MRTLRSRRTALRVELQIATGAAEVLTRGTTNHAIKTTGNGMKLPYITGKNAIRPPDDTIALFLKSAP